MPRYTMYIAASPSPAGKGSELIALERDGGIEPEIRVFLDEQLVDGDCIVDVDAGCGHVALHAATAAGREVRVLAAVETVGEQALLRRSVGEARCADTVEVVLTSELHTHLAAVSGQRVFVRGSSAGQLLLLLDLLTPLAAHGRLAAVIWPTGERSDDRRLRDALDSSAFSCFYLAAVGDAPELFPLDEEAAPAAVFSLSDAFLQSLTREPVELAAVRVAGQAVSSKAAGPLRPVPSGLDINLSAPVGPDAHGLIATCLTTELERAGHRVALFPEGVVRAVGAVGASLQRSIERQAAFSTAAPSVRIGEGGELARHVGRGPRIGFPLLDRAGFSARERHHLEAQDHLFVNSEWAKSLLELSGIQSPVSVVPLGVDCDVFHPTDEEGFLVVRAGSRLEHSAALEVRVGGPVLDIWRERQVSVPLREHETVFVNVGMHSLAGGQDVLIAAFEAAFSRTDNVRLVLANDDARPDPLAERLQLEQVGRSPLARRITRIPRRLRSPQEVAKLIAGSDCGVYPARGGAWNHAALQTLAVGRSLIATRYGCSTEFLHEDSAYLIDIDQVERASDAPDAAPWASFGQRQLDQLIESMRHVHRLKSSGALAANRSGVTVAERFSWRRSAARFATCLGELAL